MNREGMEKEAVEERESINKLKEEGIKKYGMA